MHCYSIEEIIHINCVLYWVVTRQLAAEKSEALEVLFKASLSELDEQPIEVIRAIIMGTMQQTLESVPNMEIPKNEIN